MTNKYLFLTVALVLLILTSCKKNDLLSGSVNTEMKGLHVSSEFDWETTRDVTFLISSSNATLITITSEKGDTTYYEGFFNGVSGVFSVKINIPSIISQVLVNGQLVAVKGTEVAVHLSATYKSSTSVLTTGIPTLGLIAAWHLDENAGTTAIDSAAGHNGVINGSAWVSGIRGKALHFSGNNDQVQIPYAGFDPVGNSISFSFWFRLNNVGDDGTFIFQDVKYKISIDPQGRIGFALYTPNFISVNSGFSARVLDTDWHHVVATYDGTIMKIYLDGLYRTNVSNTGNLQLSKSDVYIGRQRTINPLKATLDEMLVYDRALTETEILEIFGSTPNPGNGINDLVTWWKLNENSGNTANDSQGVNHGAIAGATWVPGISGNCLHFDGATGVVKAPTKLNLNPVYGITMMAWAKTEANTTTKIFQKGDWDGHGIGQGNWDGWGGQIRLANSTTVGINWGSGLPVLNQWYHLALTYDGQHLKYYVNGQLKNSKPVTGLLFVNGRDLSLGSDDGIQKFFKGAIDEAKFFSRALDATEIHANYAQTGNSPDQDGDGVPDQNDSYPNDPARAFNNYSPASGFGTLAFEDLWPSQGDYDFNDLVLGYRFKTVTSASNKVSEVFATFTIQAIGAGQKNGFGFQLPGAGIASSDVQVAGSKLKENFIQLNANGTEAGQEKTTVIVYDNVYKIMTFPGGFGVNVQPGATYVYPDTTVISMAFKPNTYSATELGIDHFNPFLIVNLDRGKEIHLPDNAPTSLANQAYFKTGNDDSNPASGRYYKTTTNLPWAIRVTSGYDYTLEGVQITSAYLNFSTWAESSGNQVPGWYLKDAGNRNESSIYQVPR